MQINITLKSALISAAALFVVIVALAVAFTLNRRSYESKIITLQNQVAIATKTIEVQKNVYQKLNIQTTNLISLLDSKDKFIQGLKDQLDKTDSELLTVNTLVIQLKKALSARATTTVVVKPPVELGKASTFEITSSADLGPFNVICHTQGEEPVSIAAKTDILFSQKRPIKLNVIVSQDKDGTWRTSTTSSEQDFNIDIALAAVNPFMLESKWYEKIGFNAELGIGTNPGLLGGVGITYEIGHFEVGPKVWVVLDKGVSPFFGASLGWHPFAK